MPDTRTSGVVEVSYHQFGIADGQFPMPPSVSGLVNLAEGGCVIVTGIHTGVVQVFVEVRSEPPATVDDSWEEITDVSLDEPRASQPSRQQDAELMRVARESGTYHPEPSRFRVVALMADISDPLPVLNPYGGPVRLRVHASGRGANYDGVDYEPREQYLLMTWPAPMAEEVIHKQMAHNW